MNSGVNVNDPTVIAAFKAVLLHQGLIALLIFVVLAMTWVSVRALLPAAARDDTTTQAPGTPAAGAAEPAWRQVLRIGFGLLWVFDGILQAQPKMAIGLPSQVIEPIAASSPRWVRQVVNWAGTTWSYHPMQAGASAVWIQIGIGIWLLAAARGAWSRLAGLASVGWGLVVWVFGESFGGIGHLGAGNSRTEPPHLPIAGLDERLKRAGLAQAGSVSQEGEVTIHRAKVLVPAYQAPRAAPGTRTPPCWDETAPSRSASTALGASI